MPELRETEVNRNGEWFPIDFMELKTGYTFRLINPDGTIVSSGNETNFIAASDAFLNEEGIGCVHTEVINYADVT